MPSVKIPFEQSEIHRALCRINDYPTGEIHFESIARSTNDILLLQFKTAVFALPIQILDLLLLICMADFFNYLSQLITLRFIDSLS